jgi:hypothetical protein
VRWPLIAGGPKQMAIFTDPDSATRGSNHAIENGSACYGVLVERRESAAIGRRDNDTLSAEGADGPSLQHNSLKLIEVHDSCP